LRLATRADAVTAIRAVDRAGEGVLEPGTHSIAAVTAVLGTAEPILELGADAVAAVAGTVVRARGRIFVVAADPVTAVHGAIERAIELVFVARIAIPVTAGDTASNLGSTKVSRKIVTHTASDPMIPG
jgi:hypothetical protein